MSTIDKPIAPYPFGLKMLSEIYGQSSKNENWTQKILIQ